MHAYLKLFSFKKSKLRCTRVMSGDAILCPCTRIDAREKNRVFRVSFFL